MLRSIAIKKSFIVPLIGCSFVIGRQVSNSQCDGLSPQEAAKKEVGYYSVDKYVKSNMIVGLGTGSTAYYAVERVGNKLKDGSLTNVVCIPTSIRTKEQALGLGIPLKTLNDVSHIDVAIDGADEVDDKLNLIKGGGGALLREKMVEAASSKFVCIVDESKLCKRLGPGFPIPVEITPFSHEYIIRQIEGLPALNKGQAKRVRTVLRRGSSANNKEEADKDVAVTDNGNYIVDLHVFNSIQDVEQLARELTNVVGVVGSCWCILRRNINDM